LIATNTTLRAFTAVIGLEHGAIENRCLSGGRLTDVSTEVIRLLCQLNSRVALPIIRQGGGILQGFRCG